MEYDGGWVASGGEGSSKGVTDRFDISDVRADERHCRVGRIGVGWSVDVEYANVAFPA